MSAPILFALLGVATGYVIGSNKERKCDLPGFSKDLVPDVTGIPKGAPGVPSGTCDQLMAQATSALSPEQRNAIMTVWNNGNAAQLTLLADSMAPSVMANPALAPVITCLRQKASNGTKW